MPTFRHPPVDADEEEVVDGDAAQPHDASVAQLAQQRHDDDLQLDGHATGTEQPHQQVGDGEAGDDHVGAAAEGRRGGQGEQH